MPSPGNWQPYLEAQTGEASCPWQVFDSNLVPAVLAEASSATPFTTYVAGSRVTT